MRTDVWEIHANGDTLIFGRAAALYKVPKDIRQYRLAIQILHRMMRNHEAARRIRTAYLEWSSRHLAGDLSDAEILQQVEDDIQRHRVSVIGLPHVYLHALSSKSAAAKGGTRRALIASTMPNRGATSGGHMASPTQAPPEKPISQWELTEKFTWVFKRTADSRVGPEIARTLIEMTQPEKLAEMLVISEVLAEVTLVANATPVGWVWDLALAGIAFYFGGLSALETLSDLMIFLIRTIRAQTRADLEIASSALARAAIAFTITGLTVLLHKIAARKGTGSGGGGGEAEPITATKGAGGGKTGEPPSARRTAAPKEESAAASSKPASKGSTPSKSAPGDPESSGATPSSASSDSGQSPPGSTAGQQTTPKPKSLRDQYMGRTPGKSSKTGREVIDRMKTEGKIRTDPETGATQFKDTQGDWHELADADMSHKTDAVSWWNQAGRQYGAKSPEVRQFMLDSKNYELDHYSINRSKGSILGQSENYLPPLK